VKRLLIVVLALYFCGFAQQALAPENPSTTIAINSYECGSYSAFLTGNQYSNEMGDDPSDTALFVVGDGHRYTLSQRSQSAAETAKVDFVWECSGASAASGCKISAQMIVNGMNTPNSLSLRVADETLSCSETKRAQVHTAVNTTDK